MEEINYAKRIPEPPKNLLQWLKDKGYFSKNWLIYQCGWKTEIMTGIKSKCLDVVCTACGEHFKADRCEDINLGGGGCCYPTSYYSQYQGQAGDSIIKDHEKTKCPLCGVEVECMHVHRVGREEMGTEWPLVISHDGESIIIAAYRVMRTVDKQGISKYLIQKYEAYVFTPKKSYRLCAWHSGGFGQKFLIDSWEARKKCTDQYGTGKLIYTAEKDVFQGTCLENSRFFQYVRNSGKEWYPIGYLLFYKKHPQIENLMVQGYENLVSEAVHDSREAYGYGGCFDRDSVNWKEVSPRKMLGLSKLDFNALKGKQLSSREIVSFRKIRNGNPALLPEDICKIVQTFSFHVDDLATHGKDCVKIARYCTRQAEQQGRKESKSPGGVYVTWCDYIGMAKKLGYNLQEASVKYPPHLTAAHDRAVMATKFEESKELRKKFRAMYQQLLPYAWKDGELLIRPAATEEELIKEGKILHHCVGGYGQTHCGGRPIFFIRRAEEPEAPYYTLNLNLKGQKIIQIHGYRNDALEPVPKKVWEFANKWLEKIVKAAPAQRGAKKKKATAA